MAAWVTIAVVLAVIFVALFPFDFSARPAAVEQGRFFLFWLKPVAKEWEGWGLNVLFFMPLGCSLAWWLRTRGRSVGRRGVAAFLSGLVLSTAVEYLQLFIPLRNGSWDDVAMNTLGCILGWLAFEWLGMPLLRLVGEALGELTAIFGP